MTDRTDPPRLDLRMRISLATVGVCAIALSLGALLGFGIATAFSVAVGGAIAFFNLWLLARIIAALLPPEAAEREDAHEQSRAGWAVLAVLKLFGLIAAVWLLMRHGVVSPLPMVVGFGSLPIGIAIGSLVSDRSAA